MVVIPGTNVYAVPDVDADMFFYSGWWWRLWEGQWYRSRNYNSGWGYYRAVHLFTEVYRQVGGMTIGSIVGKGINGINKNTPPASPTELEGLGKEQTLGEAKYLGCPGFEEARKAISTTVSECSTT